MKIVTYLLLGALIFAIFRTNHSLKSCQTERERTFVIRTNAAVWLGGFLFLLAFIILPNKARALMMLPALFIALSIAKSWRDSRARLRREQQERVDLERMKRVHSPRIF